jgi:hypothetical protein
LTSARRGDHPTVDDDRGDLGEGTGKLGPWANDDEGHRADKQQGDPDALAIEGDPRGGLQSDEYRHADPRELVQEGDVTMAGPGGAPQEGLSLEERRKLGKKSRGGDHESGETV